MKNESEQAIAVFGAILTMCLIVQIVTGVVLAMHYVASNAPMVAGSASSVAFASVQRIDVRSAAQMHAAVFAALPADVYIGAAAVASKLCVSVRTLQRRLDVAGTTFRDVCDDARRDLAHDTSDEDGSPARWAASATGAYCRTCPLTGGSSACSA